MILTSAYFGNSNTQGVTKCGKTRCTICHILIEGKTFHFKNCNTPFEVKRNLDCDSQNILYVMQCSECLSEYIGCTNSLRKRINLHRSNINSTANRNLPVSKHLYECSAAQFLLMPFYQNMDYDTLLFKEQHFIEKYRPALNLSS